MFSSSSSSFREVSWPILNSLHGAVDLLPSFVGSVSSPNRIVNWKGACFEGNTAWMEFHNKTGSEFGGGTLHIRVTPLPLHFLHVSDCFATLGISWVSYPHSWTCMDLYIFATPYRVTWDYYFLSREHTLEISEWEDKAEYEYVKNKGVSIFLMQAGMIGTFQALWDVFPLFTNTGWGENSNIGFLEKHMGASFEERPQPWVTNISVDDDSEGKLWIGESGHENEKGEDIIAIIPWDEWWDFELNKDDSNPHIAYLPLHSDVRAKFNETAAWEYALSMAGKPYGYHNMIFSWIDTIDGNYPPPLDAHVFIVSKCLPGNHARSFCHDSLE
ncbi:hypothetical protein V6N12_025764 [Hibiscus sabdariffa]|uniref:Uncharacterized protein n=1 Tax=Hibiscus sabdariffa TaxID=183260 RepID=A0ABR2AVE1_9ROSI